MRRTGKAIGTLAAATSLAMLGGGLAFADDVYNTLDASIDATAETMSLTVGGSNGTTTLKVSAANGDGKNGCNLTGDKVLSVDVHSSDSAKATVSPSSLTFASCDDVKTLTVTPVAAGSTTVSLVQTANTTSGSFNLAPGSFTVNVAAAAPSDSTPPVLSLPANITAEATSASGAPVTYVATANDAVDGAVTPTCLPTSGSTFEIGTTTVNCSATDAATNRATGSFTVTVRDTTAPTLSGMPENQSAVATGSNGAAVTYTAPSASDLVDANPAVSCLPASGSTFALGSTTVSCTATDSYNNTSAASTFTVTVQYAATDILQPINADGTSKFKLNSTIPVKIKLVGDSAGIADAVITQSVSKLSNAVWGEELEGASTAAPHSGNTLRYDAAGGQYIFNLASKPLGAGTYRLTLNLGGGKTVPVEFSIVK